MLQRSQAVSASVESGTKQLVVRLHEDDEIGVINESVTIEVAWAVRGHGCIT